MITGKLISVKKSILICLCLCFSLLFFSCAKTDLSDFEQMTFDDASEQSPFADMVYLIVPDAASGELVSRAEKFALNITTQTGVQAIVKYDSQPINFAADSLRILIGNTSDIISAETLRGFRKDDYICRCERGAVVIGGTGESATIAAIDRFEKEILPSSSNAFLMSQDAHFESFGEYELDSLTVNGFNIYDFTITYETVGVEDEIANALGEYISSKSGYVLSVKKYGELDRNTAKIIYLHVDEELDKNISVIERKEDNFEIRASDSYALSGAVADFASRIIPQDADTDVSVTIDTCAPIEYCQDKASFSLLIQNYEDGNTAEFLLALSGTLRRFGGDTLCLLGSGSDIVEDIKYSVPDGYEAVFYEGAQLICKNDKVDGVFVKSQNDIKLIQFFSAARQPWTVYIADRFNEQIADSTDQSIIFIKEEMADTPDIARIGEIAVGFENEKYFVYIPRTLNSSLSVESSSGEQNDFYIVCCSVKVDMKYHHDFLALKNTVE